MRDNNDVIIEESMLTHVNRWEGKPVEIKLDELDDKKSSMMIQPLAGTKKIKEYVNGSFVGQWSFAVYVRTSNADTRRKLDARKTLHSLDKWLSENLPSLSNGNTAVKIEMTATPAIAARYENGIDDYQAIFALTFNHKQGGY